MISDTIFFLRTQPILQWAHFGFHDVSTTARISCFSLSFLTFAPKTVCVEIEERDILRNFPYWHHWALWALSCLLNYPERWYFVSPNKSEYCCFVILPVLSQSTSTLLSNASDSRNVLSIFRIFFQLLNWKIGVHEFSAGDAAKISCHSWANIFFKPALLKVSQMVVHFWLLTI